jgi:hypothetical protein
MYTSNMLLSSITSDSNDLTYTQHTLHFLQDFHYFHEHCSLDHKLHLTRPTSQDTIMASISIHSLHWIDSSFSSFIYLQDSLDPNLLLDTSLASRWSIGL